MGVVSLLLVVPISSLTHINFTHFWQTDPPADESPISISVEPETATLTPGGQQTFECEANNSATLRWTYNGGQLPENALAVTTSNSSSVLTIMMATARNSGVYACLGHSPSEAFSDAAIVTVDFYGMYNLLRSVAYIKTSYFLSQMQLSRSVACIILSAFGFLLSKKETVCCKKTLYFCIDSNTGFATLYS